ncbi:TVP38/TMEM64 family protein [Clostridium perfringens]|uniref:TVP38/TMEM64 family protein n=1 Tax=Clostridium perfringens TaxID=1502 RepID=UPI0015E36FAC|nr:VTT domain-containing protein [Clostridium perfringens]MDU1968045.1 VTT domain-containing protein [Clostridium perfringens]
MNSLINIFNQYSELAIFISLFISVIIALLGIVPSVFVTGANIVFFGPINGFLISLLGEVIGGWISFKVYRKGIKRFAGNIEGKYELIDKIVKSEGRSVGILIFEGRLIPFIPSGLVTLAAAMSKVNSLIFIIATFLGKIPSILLEVLASYGVILAYQKNIKLVIGIFSLILLFLTVKRIRGNRG